MSAYICNPEHFGILAAYAATNECIIREWEQNRGPGSTIKNAQVVASGLALENIRSVAHRYPNDKDGERPGPCLLDADIVEAAAIYAGYFVKHPQFITPVQILRLIDCLDYQSCETDDWPQTLAYRQIDWLRSSAIRKLQGYDDARWEFSQPIPEVDALYERGVA